MSRKDIIMIAVLVNLGLLAILFITAMNNSEEPTQQDMKITYNQQPSAPVPVPALSQQVEEPIATMEPTHSLPIDEVDQSIREFFPETALPMEVAEDDSQIPQVQPNPTPVASSDQKTIDITVKQGDSLDKIARANGTTIQAIKKLNQLSNDKLSVGQKLKVSASSSNKASEPKPAPTPTPAASSTTPEYYTVKSGDNPWKIAKQFHVKFEDLLKLNNLDEEKARNLKVGDKLRVK